MAWLVPGDASTPIERVEPPCAPPTAALPTLQELYRQEFPFVWRTLRRLGVPVSSLDDAVQDVFVVVHRRLADFEPGAPPRPWLFGIARRVAQQQRRKRRPESAAVGFEDHVHEGHHPNPQEAALSAEAAALVQRCLAALDEDKRCVFILADLEELSGPEIAQALAENLNTVYARLRAARSQFVAALRRERARSKE